MKNKKYYTIGEVAQLLNLSATQVRYFEKILLNLNVSKVKSRRYYTVENIEVLKNKISGGKKPSNYSSSSSMLNNHSILNEIDKLLNSFIKLSFKIKDNLALGVH